MLRTSGWIERLRIVLFLHGRAIPAGDEYERALKVWTRDDT